MTKFDLRGKQVGAAIMRAIVAAAATDRIALNCSGATFTAAMNLEDATLTAADFTGVRFRHGFASGGSPSRRT